MLITVFLIAQHIPPAQIVYKLPKIVHIKKDKFQYLSHNTRIILTPVITSLAQTVVNGASNITVMGLIPRECMYL